MTKLTPNDKAALFHVIMRLEHGTKERVTKDEYRSILKLAEELEAPEFIRNYFIDKVFTSQEGAQP
jgi:hypothetical protein